MTNIYTGYVYLWYDTRAKLYYLGGHKGRVDDSYICSNAMMLRAYNKRPETFKMRVLEYVYGDTNSLREAEQRWLNLIDDSELYWTPNIYNKTVRYYNQKKAALGGSQKGHKKNRIKASWNKGYTKTEIELRSKGLLSFVPLDYPKKKNQSYNTAKVKKPRAYKVLHTKECPVCKQEFSTYKEKQKTCSKSCSGKIPWLNGTGVPAAKKGSPAWNKGLPNPVAASNGRKSKEKQSKTVTGRKIAVDSNGKRYWIYPNK